MHCPHIARFAHSTRFARFPHSAQSPRFAQSAQSSQSRHFTPFQLRDLTPVIYFHSQNSFMFFCSFLKISFRYVAIIFPSFPPPFLIRYSLSFRPSNSHTFIVFFSFFLFSFTLSSFFQFYSVSTSYIDSLIFIFTFSLFFVPFSPSSFTICLSLTLPSSTFTLNSF